MTHSRQGSPRCPLCRAILSLGLGARWSSGDSAGPSPDPWPIRLPAQLSATLLSSTSCVKAPMSAQAAEAGESVGRAPGKGIGLHRPPHAPSPAAELGWGACRFTRGQGRQCACRSEPSSRVKKDGRNEPPGQTRGHGGHQLPHRHEWQRSGPGGICRRPGQLRRLKWPLQTKKRPESTEGFQQGPGPRGRRSSWVSVHGTLGCTQTAASRFAGPSVHDAAGRNEAKDSGAAWSCQRNGPRLRKPTATATRGRGVLGHRAPQLSGRLPCVSVPSSPDSKAEGKHRPGESEAPLPASHRLECALALSSTARLFTAF